MSKMQVSHNAKSTYAGCFGTLVAMKSSGRDTWLRGPKYAKYFQLVFAHGHCAGRGLWFARRELML